MRKKLNLLLALIATSSTFAQISSYSNGSSIKQALTQMEDSARTFLLLTSLVGLAIGLFFFGIAAAVYFLKLRKSAKKDALWIAVAIIAGLIGLITLVQGAMGILAYLTTPSLVKGMVVGG